MRSLRHITVAGVFLLAACDTGKKPSDANFTAAINQYLTTHDQACTSIGSPFPIDVPRLEQNGLSAVSSKMEALKRASLVHATDTTAVVPGLLDALRGTPRPQPVIHYQLTVDGQKYFRQIPGTFGQTGVFCYGEKTVDSIVKWTEGSQSQAEVTYTYKIVNLAAWAERPDVQEVFPDIEVTVNGASKTNQIVGVQLTNKGWEVPRL
jgi:hypothetical protein